MFDANGDGQIDAMEWSTPFEVTLEGLRQRVLAEYEHSDAGFKAADTDGNGDVELWELVDALVDTCLPVGQAFPPPPPVLEGDIEDRPIGGLGVHLVRSMMDQVDYARIDGRNVVTLRKQIPAGIADD